MVDNNVIKINPRILVFSFVHQLPLDFVLHYEKAVSLQSTER